jgi:hypothetical protein
MDVYFKRETEGFVVLFIEKNSYDSSHVLKEVVLDNGNYHGAEGNSLYFDDKAVYGKQLWHSLINLLFRELK